MRGNVPAYHNVKSKPRCRLGTETSVPCTTAPSSSKSRRFDRQKTKRASLSTSAAVLRLVCLPDAAKQVTASLKPGNSKRLKMFPPFCYCFLEDASVRVLFALFELSISLTATTNDSAQHSRFRYARHHEISTSKSYNRQFLKFKSGEGAKTEWPVRCDAAPAHYVTSATGILASARVDGRVRS